MKQYADATPGMSGLGVAKKTDQVKNISSTGLKSTIINFKIQKTHDLIVVDLANSDSETSFFRSRIKSVIFWLSLRVPFMHFFANWILSKEGFRNA